MKNTVGVKPDDADIFLVSERPAHERNLCQITNNEILYGHEETFNKILQLTITKINFMNIYFESLSSIISGIVSGLIASFIFYLYQKKKENKEKLIIDISPNLKSVPKNILDHVRPGFSIEKMREILGVPNYIYDREYDEESLKSTNVYEYRFKNIFITIVSDDGKSIDTVDAFTRSYMDFNVEFSINPFDNECRGIIGKSTINFDLLESISKIETTSMEREEFYKIITYHGRYGNFMQYSFFCYIDSNLEDKNWEHEDNANKLIGKIISGFRISNH